jgi:hypothetical protein
MRMDEAVRLIEKGAPDAPSGWIELTATGPRQRISMILSPRFYAGYQDARLGLAYRSEYDAWHSFLQRSYECGRAMVACMRGEGFDPPPWLNRLDYVLVAQWFEDRRRRFPDELLLPEGDSHANR